MKFIIGRKVEITQVFGDDGKVNAATVLEAPPIIVTQLKNPERDGYAAVQVGFGTRRAKRISKPQRGHYRTLGSFAGSREFRVDPAELPHYEVGKVIDASVFTPGETVTVSGISKGKGFQGVVKRHGFRGGPRTHGQKHSEREPGSIGSGLRTRVPKGTRMAGRMGGERVTVKNLSILASDIKSNRLVVSGAVPGRRGSIVEVRSTR